MANRLAYQSSRWGRGTVFRNAITSKAPTEMLTANPVQEF
jgi:hypothetical protein